MNRHKQCLFDLDVLPLNNCLQCFIIWCLTISTAETKLTHLGGMLATKRRNIDLF